MGKYSIRQSVKRDIVPLRDSFQFNYGKATVRLDPDGTYTLMANGSEYSEYVNSARRAYQYKPTVQKLSEKMREAYDQQTFDFTHLNYRLSPSRSRVSIENTLDKLVLQKYTNKPFAVKQPTKAEIRAELEYEASQLYFKTFGTNTKQIEEYVNAHLQDALDQRLKTWLELSDYHDAIQAQNAEKQNLIYFKEYTDKKEELENILSGPTRFVDAEIRKRLSDIHLPFDIELDYTYSKQQKQLDVEVEVPLSIPIPFQKATMLASGKVSIKNKTAKEQDADYKQCIYGLTYYIASKFFDVSTNIEKISVTVWEEGKKLGLIWVEFPRDDFNDLVKRNRQFDPVFYITIGEYYSPLAGTSRSSIALNSQRTVFLKMIAGIKGITVDTGSTSKTASSSKSPRSSSANTGSSLPGKVSAFDNGDLNPDPFHLTVQEATLLSSFVNDPALEKEVQDAMWAGDDTVPIHPKYASIWADIKGGMGKH